MVTSNGFLNKAHVKYLESKFIELASDAGIYEVKQAKASNSPRLSDADVSDMQTVVREAKILLPALGYRFLEKTSKKTSKEKAKKAGRALFLEQGKDVRAEAIQTESGITLIKGSKIRSKIAPSCPKKAKRLREEFAVKISSENMLLEDIELPSLNAAAAFVTGNSISAPENWKTVDGISLKELDSETADSLDQTNS